ncbi:hypothetical protein QMK19_38560 [Streptomyces sp. H10-C2]|uniref:hypothetical protein n=1 Tax=unclassified Streptomyces TaxID=2593676 RepID=UPI0024BA1AA6|nr:MULTISPECIES: hypothetical protein [unclassified Streptomyces]MDJ0347109.1 hypothetical protein [Streptomyces sp. PH10-H1]MDJ0375342.1 hypothetical protein [Streptomyces sp. H10-C2]
MGSDIRYRAERIALALMAASGIVVLLADLFGWLDALAPGGALPKVTLLILSTVTVFLLLEIDRLKKLDDVQAQLTKLDDNVQAQLSKLDIDAVARQLKQEHYGGVVKVHGRFPEEEFARFVEGAGQEVTILQTWIPNLHHFKRALEKAIVDQRVPVRILLLHPSSPVAGLRDEALRTVRDPALSADVKASVEGCLARLAELHWGVGEEDRARLQVRVYNSLPSIAVYKADEHFLVSSFLHGQLAIDSTQIEIDGGDTVMGQEVQRELNTLWSIGSDVDLCDWRASISTISL